VVRDQRKLVEAEDIHREALAMRRKLLGQEHPLVAISLFNLADVLCDEGKLAEAEPLVRECLSIRERRIPDQWRVFSTRSLLGGILLARRQYAEAEPLLVSGYEGMRQREEKISADGKMHPKEALERLVQLYEATGQPEKAAEYKQKLGRVEDKTQNKR
jgi:tetratricopeptide (TPR) repeat protein